MWREGIEREERKSGDGAFSTAAFSKTLPHHIPQTLANPMCLPTVRVRIVFGRECLRVLSTRENGRQSETT